MVHRLVATAFIPNPKNKPHINHINKDRADNRIDNIEWSTPRENTQHSYTFKKNNVSSKYMGVSYWDRGRSNWCARYRDGGKDIILGYFKTELEAATAYKNKMIELGESIKYIK